MSKLKFIAGIGAASLLLAACGGGATGGTTGGSGDTTTLRVAFNQTENHPQYIALTEMGERLEEATGGAYSIEVYPNATLGAQQETIQLLQDGSLEMALVGGAQLENFSEDFVVFNLPYVFESQEHQRQVTNDPEIIGDLYASLEDKDITVLAAFHGGVRNVYTKGTPVRTPQDMQGLKIRVQESDTHIAMLNLMGGQATPMAQGEVYTAIQSGVLDGGENNELVFFDLKQVEVAPVYSYTRHLMVPDYLIINPAVLAGMSEEHRAAFEEELATAVEEEGELWGVKVEEAIEGAEAAGAEFIDNVDAEAFREILEPFVEETIPQSESALRLYETTRAAAQG
jgi:tripartite ATP-independent transporter DctP family solute receptor